MENAYVLTAIATMAFVTFLLRLTPFIVPQSILKQPIAQKIANFTPLVIMVLLVVDAFKGQSPGDLGAILPLVLGIGTVAAIQFWLRIPLISILVGVAVHIAALNM